MVKKSRNLDKEKISRFFESYYRDKNQGKIVVITGASFSGKSGFLGSLAGIVPVDKAGQKAFDPEKTTIGYMPQYAPFYRDSSLKKEISYIAGISENVDDEFCQAALKSFRLQEYHTAPFKKLSDSVLQKAAIVQAFLGRPRQIFLDEPLHRLDQNGISEFTAFLREYKQNYLKDATVTIASDNLAALWDIADEIYFVDDKSIGERLGIAAIKKKILVYSISEGQWREFSGKYPDVKFRNSAKGDIRIILCPEEAEKMENVLLTRQESLMPEDAFRYYCNR